MIKRQPIFPHVIELNHQARRRISCSVYLIYDDDGSWALIDIGYEDAVDECLEIIRQLDFPFSKCVTLIASHADVDHIQGLAKAKQVLKTRVTCHPFRRVDFHRVHSVIFCEHSRSQRNPASVGRSQQTC